MSRVSNGLPPSNAYTESDPDSSLEIALAATLELVWRQLSWFALQRTDGMTGVGGRIESFDSRCA